MAIWQAIVGGATYSLGGGNPFWRVQATGLGMPPIRNLTQRGPYQHGSTRRGFQLNDRLLNLLLISNAATKAQADAYRDDLVEIFKPLTDTPVCIRVTRDDGAIRQIDCYADGVIDLPDTPLEARIGNSQRILATLVAPDPIWYDPQLINTPFEATLTATEGYQIPMEVPLVQASGEEIDVIETIAYAGNWQEFPVIVITGPGIDPVITNLATGEKLEFSATLENGDTRTIDLRYGTKTVRDAAGTLRNSELTSDSDLGTWHLEPAPGAAGGQNNIHVEILTGAGSATSVSMRYYNRYLHL